MSCFGREGTKHSPRTGEREEIDTDFRVFGLPHTVMKQAENFRVRELVKKIESHPHRERLHADLQHDNVPTTYFVTIRQR